MQVFKLLSVEHRQLEKVLVGGGLKFGRVCHYYLGVFYASVNLVDDDIIEHSGRGIFALHVEVHVGNAVVEYAFGNFERRRCALH